MSMLVIAVILLLLVVEESKSLLQTCELIYYSLLQTSFLSSISRLPKLFAYDSSFSHP